MESLKKPQQVQKNRSELVVARGRGGEGWENWVTVVKTVQTSSYKVNKFEDVMHNMLTVANNTVL